MIVSIFIETAIDSQLFRQFLNLTLTWVMAFDYSEQDYYKIKEIERMIMIMIVIGIYFCSGNDSLESAHKRETLMLKKFWNRKSKMKLTCFNLSRVFLQLFNFNHYTPIKSIKVAIHKGFRAIIITLHRKNPIHEGIIRRFLFLKTVAIQSIKEKIG